MSNLTAGNREIPIPLKPNFNEYMSEDYEGVHISIVKNDVEEQYAGGIWCYFRFGEDVHGDWIQLMTVGEQELKEAGDVLLQQARVLIDKLLTK